MSVQDLKEIWNTWLAKPAYDLGIGLIIFWIGLRWNRITAFIGRHKLKLGALLGRESLEKQNVTVVLDTYHDTRIASIEC